MAAERWYYAETGGRSEGPVHRSMLSELAAEGTITDDTLVWRDGLEDWLPYGQLAVADEPKDESETSPPDLRRFVPAPKRAFLAGLLLASVAALNGYFIVLMFRLLGFLDILETGNAPDQREMMALDRDFGLLSQVIVVVVIATAVLFIAWLHRAHANLRAFHRGRLRYSPGWAIGGWFVPFLNLVRPYQVTREVWDVSHRVARNHGADLARGGATVLVWWLLFIGGSMLGRIAGRLERGADELDRIRTLCHVELVASLVSMAAAGAAILVVLGVQRAQTAAADIGAVFE